METLDPAFQSRVHVGLHYKDLDRKALRQIWKTFLTKVAEEELATAATAASTSVDPSSAPSTATKQQPRTICTSEEIDILCRKSLNGRMIKNAVVTAQALAASMGEAMGMKHLKLVLDVTEEFDGDMGGAGGGDRVSLYT